MTAQDVVAGARDAAQSVMALAVVLAACLAVTRPGWRGVAAGAVLLGAGVLAAHAVTDRLASAAGVAFSVAACGAFTAAGAQARGRAAPVLLLLAGVPAGLAAGLQTATAGESLGSSGLLMTLAAATLACRAGARLPAGWQPVARVARRTAGAWLTALGVLMLTLALRAPS